MLTNRQKENVHIFPNFFQLLSFLNVFWYTNKGTNKIKLFKYQEKNSEIKQMKDIQHFWYQKKHDMCFVLFRPTNRQITLHFTLVQSTTLTHNMETVSFKFYTYFVNIVVVLVDRTHS